MWRIVIILLVLILWRFICLRRCSFHTNIVYINLGRRPDRNQHILKQMQKNKCTNYKRFAAVDGSKMRPDYHDVRIHPYYNLSENMRWDSNVTKYGIQKLSTGEMGCIMSHRSVWEGMSRQLLILEDDAVFSKDFSSRFKYTSASLPADWDIFYLGYISTGGLQKFSKHLRKVVFVYGAYAYMLSLRGVQKILDELPIDRPLDNFLGKLTETGKINGYAAYPELISQIEYGGKGSDIVHSAHT